MTATSTAALAQNADAATIERFARWLPQGANEAREVRVLESPMIHSCRPWLKEGTHAGFFSDPSKIASAVSPWSSGHAGCGVYISANPYPADFLARANHRLVHVGKKGGTCGTAEAVARLVVMPLDFDPVRPTGIPATDDELNAAIAARDEARERLDELDVAGASAMSGNGSYLLLPTPGYANTPENCARWGRLLDGFVRAFSRDGVKLDEKCKNADRIIRLFGAVNSKGDGSSVRPWRLSTFDDVGDFDPTDLLGRADELLRALNAEAPTVVEVRRPASAGAKAQTPSPAATTPSDVPPRHAARPHDPSGPGYDEHWAAIGPRAVVLVPELGPSVPSAGDRIECTCPACGREAWIGLRGTPYLACKHEKSCKHHERLSEYLQRERGLAGNREVLALLASVSGLAPPAKRNHSGAAAGRRQQQAEVKARSALYALPESVETWQWVGFHAERRVSTDAARALVPMGYREAFDRGADAAKGGAKSIGQPVSNERLMKAAKRALEVLGAPDAGTDDGEDEKQDLGDLSIVRLIHHERPQGLGGLFDVELRLRGSQKLVRGLSGQELGSYARTRGRALEVRLMLPTPFKGANEEWEALVGSALDEAEVVELPDVAEPVVAVENVIIEFLRAAPRGETVDDFDRGGVLEDEARSADGMRPGVERVLLVKPQAVLAHVKQAMTDDGLKRGEVIAAALRLGAASKQRRLPTGETRRPLMFPAPLVDDAS